jgi:hypothetical protein
MMNSRPGQLFTDGGRLLGATGGGRLVGKSPGLQADAHMIPFEWLGKLIAKPWCFSGTIPSGYLT